MKLGKAQEIFAYNIAKLILFADNNGFKCRIREVQRTLYQQKIYFRQSKTKTMKSKHLDSLAADIYFFIGNNIIFEIDKLSVLGDYWQSLHPLNKWGGYFKKFIDAPHFEMNRT